MNKKKNKLTIKSNWAKSLTLRPEQMNYMKGKGGDECQPGNTDTEPPRGSANRIC
ncbi:hypothetical protein [Microscilla marina]|uniref:hypothetical protein n=1 Tax=Microscilla marina TaxID=1027 RepID=UPI0012FAFC36|nr:hypothetical protein [Microscilla marina]